MAGGRVPFHGATEARIEIGQALGDAAEFQRAAGGDALGHMVIFEITVQLVADIVRTAGQHDDAILRLGPGA